LGRYVNLIHKGRIGSAVGRDGKHALYSEERSAYAVVGAAFRRPRAINDRPYGEGRGVRSGWDGKPVPYKRGTRVRWRM